ncbi:carbohydrate ABC transporter permease [Chloroflexota bacterium]
MMKKSKFKNFKEKSAVTFTTAFTAAILGLFLLPFLYMILTSLKTPIQMQTFGAPIWPAQNPTFSFEDGNTGTYSFEVRQGENINTVEVVMGDYVGKELDVYSISQPDGTPKSLALVRSFPKQSVFIDPADPEAPPFLWEGSWRTLERPWEFSPTWSNYSEVWENLDYPRIMWNTIFYAIMTTIGVLISCTIVAFGFSRFRFPGRDFLFVILLSTMFLPGAVTVVPTFTFFTKIGWVGTWLPLIVPSFFANAYDTFLLRQYFMTLPRELDEAAMIDGASPLKVLWSVILPQSWPAIVAVSVFHIVFSWNDYFGPLIYLSTEMQKQPISVAIARFNGIYGQQPQLIQAGALMTLIIPLIIFFLAQRFFIQGIVITGVDK